MTVGALVAIYGALGVAQALQNAMNVAWAVPRNRRPNPLRMRLRSLVLITIGGVAVLATTILSALGGSADAFGADMEQWSTILVVFVAVVVNAAVFILAFRICTAHPTTVGDLVPGAITAAIVWQLLQLFGTAYVGNVVKNAGATYGVFALVLGLLAWIFLAAVGVVMSTEINVVRAKRLYPRALMTPFTDDVDLTPADRRVYTDAALAQQAKGFQWVTVSFDDEGQQASARRIRRATRLSAGCGATDRSRDHGRSTVRPVDDWSARGSAGGTAGEVPGRQVQGGARPPRRGCRVRVAGHRGRGAADRLDVARHQRLRVGLGEAEVAQRLGDLAVLDEPHAVAGEAGDGEGARVEHAGVPEVGHEHAPLDAGDQLGDGRVGGRPVDLVGNGQSRRPTGEGRGGGRPAPTRRSFRRHARSGSAPASAAERRSCVSDTVVPRSTRTRRWQGVPSLSYSSPTASGSSTSVIAGSNWSSPSRTNERRSLTILPLNPAAATLSRMSATAVGSSTTS